MNIPINKNRSWIAHLHRGTDQMDERSKAAIMRPAGAACASDLLTLCEERLQKTVESIEDLVTGGEHDSRGTASERQVAD